MMNANSQTTDGMFDVWLVVSICAVLDCYEGEMSIPQDAFVLVLEDGIVDCESGDRYRRDVGYPVSQSNECRSAVYPRIPLASYG